MNESINVVLQLHKGAEAGELGHFTVDQVTDLILFIDHFPRIVGQLFNPKTDALIDFVDVDHDRFHFIAFLKHLAGVIDFSGPT
ncbi:MAG: hypothetical protein Udaeo_06790 [Candidatus Udaeobacter sp.]|nr:MAG: hypothetical protein Udaeo_06790 [Candidatus Udaeobacter sp.]